MLVIREIDAKEATDASCIKTRTNINPIIVSRRALDPEILVQCDTDGGHDGRREHAKQSTHRDSWSNLGKSLPSYSWPCCELRPPWQVQRCIEVACGLGGLFPIRFAS